MIQITAYLRDDKDLVKWKDLANKTEFLHEALQAAAYTDKNPKKAHITPHADMTRPPDSARVR